MIILSLFILSTVTPNDDNAALVQEILDLDESVKYRMEQGAERSSDEPDKEGAELARICAELRERRISLLLVDQRASPVEIAAEQLTTANTWMNAFRLDPTKSIYLDRALRLLLLAESQNTDPSAHLAVTMHDSYIKWREFHELARPSAARPKCAQTLVRCPPSPRKAVVPRREGRITGRLEGGAGAYVEGGGGAAGTSFGIGYLNASIHGRFPFKRVALLMGPYFSFLAHPSHLRSWDMGGRFEIEIHLSPRRPPKASLHPFVEMGVGVVRAVSEDPLFKNTDGVTLASGVAFCFLSASLCPNFRLKLVPTLSGGVVATVPQLGLAISLGNFPY